jgi:hypothetical protein
MLDLLRAQAAVSDRKERLWACACCRRLLHLFPEGRHRRHGEVAERYADATAGREELRKAQTRWAWGFSLDPGTGCEPDNLAWVAPDRLAEVAAQADLLRNIFGRPPFCKRRLDPRWWTPLVLSLAQAAYQERVAPDPSRPGWLVLDLARLAVLADALEDAGCTDATLLSHLRGPGPHVRGCFALDLVLAKSLTLRGATVRNSESDLGKTGPADVRRPVAPAWVWIVLILLFLLAFLSMAFDWLNLLR